MNNVVGSVGRKYVECCEILTMLTSYLQKVEQTEQEKDWFIIFSASFLSILFENNKLCVRCVRFYQVFEGKQIK